MIELLTATELAQAEQVRKALGRETDRKEILTLMNRAERPPAGHKGNRPLWTVEEVVEVITARPGRSRGRAAGWQAQRERDTDVRARIEDVRAGRLSADAFVDWLEERLGLTAEVDDA